MLTIVRAREDGMRDELERILRTRERKVDLNKSVAATRRPTGAMV